MENNRSEYFRRRSIILKERKKIARNRIYKLRKNPTKFENIFKRRLTRLKYKFIFQKAFYNEWYFCIVDFYIPKYKVAIELDGIHHYNNFEQKKKDAGHEKYLKKKGIRVIRLRNEVALSIRAKELHNIIKN